jgi:hypothetical protein
MGCATRRTVLLKQVQAMATATVELDTNMAACLFSVGRCEAVTRRPLLREKTEQQSR